MLSWLLFDKLFGKIPQHSMWSKEASRSELVDIFWVPYLVGWWEFATPHTEGPLSFEPRGGASRALTG
jgi:hypothetical protein